MFIQECSLLSNLLMPGGRSRWHLQLHNLDVYFRQKLLWTAVNVDIISGSSIPDLRISFFQPQKLSCMKSVIVRRAQHSLWIQRQKDTY